MAKKPINKYARLRKELAEYHKKAEKTDKFIRNIDDIKKKAELDAAKLIEDAQADAMDAISVIDDVKKSIEEFKQDMFRLRDDLKIGTMTVEDRLMFFDYTLQKHENKLNHIKQDFYKKYNLN